jgi:hypothetical protein
MGFLEFLSDLLTLFCNIPSYEKPRRAFTRGFVAFCVLVAVLELMILNHIYSGL